MPGAIGQRPHRYLLDSSDENLKAQAATAQPPARPPRRACRLWAGCR